MSEERDLQIARMNALNRAVDLLVAGKGPEDLAVCKSMATDLVDWITSGAFASSSPTAVARKSKRTSPKQSDDGETEEQKKVLQEIVRRYKEMYDIEDISLKALKQEIISQFGRLPSKMSSVDIVVENILASAITKEEQEDEA